jgi:uncharacterized protein (TIGR00255 family)
MIHSMTGYATASKELAGSLLTIELRSVNHRFFDVGFRMPDELRALESGLREAIAARVTRGKLECRVSLGPAAGSAHGLQLNTELLGRVRALETEVRSRAAGAGPLTVAELLRWPGMLGDNAPPVDELRTGCLALLGTVLGEFTASRAREGEQLKRLLLERVAGIEGHVAALKPKLPQMIVAYQEKLTAKLREAMGGGDADRIQQEVVLFANKIDVDEELSRLITHLAEVRRVLEKGGAAGKRLDFLMQELNREANTLGSKSADVAVTQTSVELKVLIEQMREQIQNVE